MTQFIYLDKNNNCFLPMHKVTDNASPIRHANETNSLF